MIEKSISEELRNLEETEILRTIISALEKACEQDVVQSSSARCPRCGDYVWDEQRYCFMCGQKLRWSRE